MTFAFCSAGVFSASTTKGKVSGSGFGNVHCARVVGGGRDATTRRLDSDVSLTVFPSILRVKTVSIGGLVCRHAVRGILTVPSMELSREGFIRLPNHILVVTKGHDTDNEGGTVRIGNYFIQRSNNDN